MSDWYKKSFGSDYLTVYGHRDVQGASREVRAMIGWLGLPEGATVLDLCCGMGRHSLALNEAGYLVTGVDLSETLLKEARRFDTEHRIRFIQGDMRKVPLDESFDAVVNLFTSFGYFDSDEENAKVFLEIARLLKPDGSFIVDFLNPAYVAKTLVPRSSRTEGRLAIEETRRIEGRFVRKAIRLVDHGRPEREYHEQVKLYVQDDFRRLMEGTGLVITRTFGGYDGAAYKEDESARLIIVGEKRRVDHA